MNYQLKELVRVGMNLYWLIEVPMSQTKVLKITHLYVKIMPFFFFWGVGGDIGQDRGGEEEPKVKD